MVHLTTESLRQIRRIATLIGWEAERASLYDEEGVEGWRWTGTKEFHVVGSWDEDPAMDEDVIEAILNDAAARLAKDEEG